MDLLNTLVDKGLRRELPTREEALAVLATSDDELLDVVAAAGKVRRQWFGRRVKLNYLVNLKSGLCPEDCSYCSQRLGSKAEILKYTWLKPDEASQAAAAGRRGRRQAGLPGGERPRSDRPGRRPGLARPSRRSRSRTRASRCAPASGCSPTARRSGCATAGADAYNHNLNTSEATYGDITHHPHLRRPGRHRAEGAGGGPVRLLRADRGHGRERRGPGRRRLLAARAGPGLGAGQLPDPLRGHPAGQGVEPHPAALPADPGDGAVRLPGRARCGSRAAARSICATMQPLALHLANSIFLGDYLTSEGQAGKADLDMIADAGFEVEGTDTTTLPRAPRATAAAAGGGCGSHGGAAAGRTRRGPAAGRTRAARSAAEAPAAEARRRGAYGPGGRTPPGRRDGPRAQCLTCRVRPARAELLELDRRACLASVRPHAGPAGAAGRGVRVRGTAAARRTGPRAARAGRRHVVLVVGDPRLQPPGAQRGGARPARTG